MAILVIGSANLDHTINLDRPVLVGETMLAHSVIRAPGGKGANQAVAAARLSAPHQVAFVGCLGDDQPGSMLIDRLNSEGVDTGLVRMIAGAPTGAAYVMSFAGGDNSIAVVQGANLFLDSGAVDRALTRFQATTATVVLQGEMGLSALTYALKQCGSRGLRVVLNLAPLVPVPHDLLATCDPLIVNQTEACGLLGRESISVHNALSAVGELATVARSAVITLGEHGAAWSTGAESGVEPSPPVEKLIDSLGAGDAFVGAAAVALSEGANLREAVRMGVKAGAFSVARPGAQSSYPMRGSIS